LLLSPPPTEFSLLDFFLCLLRELERLLEEDEEDDEDEEELEVDLLFLDICLINSFELNNPFLDRDLLAFFSFFLLREDPDRLLDLERLLYSLLLLLRGITAKLQFVCNVVTGLQGACTRPPYHQCLDTKCTDSPNYCGHTD